MIGVVRSRLFVLVVGLLSICPALLQAGEESEKKAKGEFGILVGSLSGMTIELESKETPGSTWDFDTDGGFTAALYFEQRSLLGLWAGLTLDYMQVKKDFGSLSSQSRAGLGLALRLSTRINSASGELSFRPGVASGVALFPEVFSVQTSQYWTLSPFAEVVYTLSPKLGMVGQVSVLNTVWGGNDDYNISAGPAVLMRIGLVFK